MPSEKVIKDRYGAMVAPYRYTSTIELSTTLRLLRSTSSLGLIKGDITTSRSFTSSGIGARRRRRDEAKCPSGRHFAKAEITYREEIVPARQRFAKFSVTSAVQRVHEASVSAKIPCAVPEGVHCPHCSPGAPRISESDLTGYTTNRVPANVKELRAKLFCTRQHPNVVPVHNTPQKHCTPQCYASRPWWASYAFTISGTSDIRTFRGNHVSRWRTDCLQTNRTSVRLRVCVINNPIHFAVDLRCAETRAALVNASMCEAARTVSNIRVQVFEQVRLLREKVKRVEEKLRALRASYPASHHD
ncbi:hypothetical protein PHMEG_00035023 [Phytophthora megakarya]|uniref:Uncharacterized protein n=1 Tax=Phytophthora megakarya TaxID=4795 RepID=A0A225UPU9_9STRA|nr:hypothetical protein PHMEG_00035023 [Phytophthora megakarya]